MEICSLLVCFALVSLHNDGNVITRSSKGSVFFFVVVFLTFSHD